MKSNVVVGQELPLEIKRMGINGEGIGYYKKQAIFVDGAIPGEEYSIIIEDVQNGYAKGRVSRLKKASSNRVEPFCPYYEKCGACQLQHVKYEETLALKRDLIIQAIERYTNINPRSFEIKPTIGMSDPFGYRNKASLPLAHNGVSPVVGIYEVNSNHLVHISECKVQSEVVNKVIAECLEIFKNREIPIYNQKTKQGILRYIIVRTSTTGDVQVTLILNQKADLTKLANEILKVNHVKSVYQDINDDYKSNQFFGDNLTLLAGDKTITETLGKFKFDLMPNAFFQLNPKQTIVLYDLIKKAARLSKKETVYDLYCGVGTIGIWVSDLAGKVLAIEENKEAIANAKANALQNKIPNIAFYDGSVNKMVPYLFKNNTPDVVLVDPPRTGLGQMLIELLNKHKPKRIVYTSCNPSTLAKDLKMLSENYRLKMIEPIDLFPFTSRIEAVCSLELIDKKQ